MKMSWNLFIKQEVNNITKDCEELKNEHSFIDDY